MDKFVVPNDLRVSIKACLLLGATKDVHGVKSVILCPMPLHSPQARH